MLSEIKQSQVRILYDATYIPRVAKLIGVESRMLVARGLGEGRMENYHLMNTISVCDVEKFCRLIIVMVSK